MSTLHGVICSVGARAEAQNSSEAVCRYGGEACSKSRAALEYGDVVQREPAQFEYEYFLMPAITGE